jgi:crotonobetainyl-CoA:carnitine CoA-transferase CaiB-like acyl-CoA transferase
VSQTDILIEGLRPGTLEKMGLGWSNLTSLKPNLVMVAVNGYGSTGPYRDMPSHGPAFDAVAGLAPAEEDELGRIQIAARQLRGMGMVLAPLFASTAAIAALQWARRTGQPVFLEVAQTDAALFANMALEEVASRRQRGAGGRTDPAETAADRGGVFENAVTTQYYRTRDNKVLLLMALERKFFVRLAEVVGRPDILAQFPEDHYADQLHGNDEVRSVLSEAIGSRDLDDWMAIFSQADIPAVPVNEGPQVLDDPQVKARVEWLSAADSTVTMKTPVRSRPRLASPGPAPALGEGTTEILRNLGLTPAQIAELLEAGVIRTETERG